VTLSLCTAATCLDQERSSLMMIPRYLNSDTFSTGSLFNTTFESVKRFALKVCSKQWDASYNELLDVFRLPSLQNRRLYIKLCYLFKIVHGLCYFPPDVVVQNTNLTHSSRPLILHQPFSRTNHFYHSFIPSAVRTWNNLPEYIVCAPNYTSFRTPLRCFFC